jgi:hypothetical protein
MKKVFKRMGIFLLLLFVVIQFIRTAKNNSTQPTPSSITTQHIVPTNVATILSKACNDCHSNNTIYPWYNNVQPVTWWLNNHITNGKRHLNFDEFTSYRIAKQYKRMNDCIEEIKENEMPLESYTWIHKDAILTEAEKQTLYDWFNSVRDSIKAKYPADSLVLPKKK